MSAHAAVAKKLSIAPRSVAAVRVQQNSQINAQTDEVSLLLSRHRIQAKSLNFADDDQYEKEAEHIAHELIHPKNKTLSISTLPVERVPLNSNAPTEDAEQFNGQNKLIRELLNKEGGSPLAEQDRIIYEDHLQQDFSDVKIHNDLQADHFCRQIQAQTFTYGSHIYFRSGHYNPKQVQGKMLLAHELTHVVQQGRSKKLQRKASPASSIPIDTSSDFIPDNIVQDNNNSDGSKKALEKAKQTEKNTLEQQDNSLSELDKQSKNNDEEKVDTTEVAIELPEQDKPISEQVSEIKNINFQGSSDQAMLSFTDAAPSSMALSQPELGKVLDKKLNEEAKSESESVPVLLAKANGQESLAMVSPEPVKKTSDYKSEGDTQGDDNKKLIADEHQNVGKAPNNSDNKKRLDKQESGRFLSWFRSHFSSFLQGIKISDKGLNTSAGERQKVALNGNADLNRANNARTESDRKLIQQKDQSTAAFKTHPGQLNIQTRAVNEEKTVDIKSESNVEIVQEKNQGMADYAEMPLPKDVRDKSDELLQPSISNSLVDARKQTRDAAGVKESEKKKEISQAESNVTGLNKQADQEQKEIVLENRGKVAEQQRQGIQEATDSVNEFSKNAGDKQSTLSADVKIKVKDSESSAKKELEQGEQKAYDKRILEENKAAEKKRELQKEQKNDSWWDRAVSAVKSAVKVISDAIDTIFTALRDAVKTIIETAKNAAVALINTARDWVVDKLNKFRDWAKEQVNRYLKDVFPELAKRINQAIDLLVDAAVTVVNAVADTLIKGVEALAKGLSLILDKILSVFQGALKAAVQIAGAVLTGDFAEALRIAIRAACDIAGIDSKPIFDFIDRAAGAVTKILKDPVAFFMNIVNGVGGGVKRFAKNIKKHLINGLLGWLTGALSEVEIQLPEKLDFKGVLDLGLQILGLTYENIKARVIKRFPPAEKAFDLVETGVDIIKKILIDGPIAIWVMVKESVSNLKEIVLTGIRNFVVINVAKEAVGWLLGLLNPAGAIVKVVKLLYDFTMFLVERFTQIKNFIMSVYGTITAIASGQLAKVMSTVEEAMAKSLPVVLSLLASLAGLGGIGKAVKNIISKVSKPINKVIDKIIDKIILFVKKVLGKDKKGDSSRSNKNSDSNSNSKSDTSRGNKSAKPGAINLADLNKPPVSNKRSKTEMKLHLKRVHQLLSLAGNGSKNTDDIENYFPKLKKRYRLRMIEYDKVGGNKLGIRIKINPDEIFTDFPDNLEVKANDADEVISLKKPIIKTESISVQKNGQSFQDVAGVKMTAEHLAPNHPMGSETSGGELSQLFKVLPTRKDYSGGYKANQVYIRGHLLNANLGGAAENRNLFPITQKANSDHHNKIEKKAKELVNDKGLLVKYEVAVKSRSMGEKNGFSYINSVFDCTLATYTLKNGELSPSNKKLHVTIPSIIGFDGSTISKGSVVDEGVKQKSFDSSKVKRSDGNKIKYLTDMSSSDLVNITGVNSARAVQIIKDAIDGKIKNFKTLEKELTASNFKKIKEAGISLRLYHR